MPEGWHEDDYIVIFDRSFATELAGKYELNRFLPNYSLIGLRGWDDFIVSVGNGETYTVPTVPMLSKYLAPYSVPSADLLSVDDRFVGRVKWYVQPLVFGGDPNGEENLAWVDFGQHAKAVVYWNDIYREQTSTA